LAVLNALDELEAADADLLVMNEEHAGVLQGRSSGDSVPSVLLKSRAVGTMRPSPGLRASWIRSTPRYRGMPDRSADGMPRPFSLSSWISTFMSRFFLCSLPMPRLGRVRCGFWTYIENDVLRAKRKDRACDALKSKTMYASPR
jgi:hypothetical protein